MSNVFTLESLKEETKRSFAPFVIGLSDGTETALVSGLRLSAEDRKTVEKALGEIGRFADAEDTPENLEAVIEVISKVFYTISDKPTKLLADLHDDDTVVKATLMTRVLQAWVKETKLGEA